MANDTLLFPQLQKHPHDRALNAIAITVIAVHLTFLLIALLVHSQPDVKVKKPERLIVKTIALTPTLPQKIDSKTTQEAKKANAPAQAVSAEPISAPAPMVEPAPPQSTPKPKSESLQKKETPKPAPTKKAAEKKPAATKKPETKPKATAKKKIEPKKEVPKAQPKKESKPKQPPAAKPKAEPKPEKPKVDPQVEAANAKAAAENQAKRRELIANAQKNIANIKQGDTLNSKQTSALASAAVPGKISALHIEGLSDGANDSLSTQERSYYDELASRLKLLLRLPEYGEVKIKLTLERSGRFVKVSVVSAKSSANRAYIEKTLPSVRYPGFGKNFESQDQYTFGITLSNDL
ncbi:MAG: hypothetical protein H0X51_03065 [Parachlamydiaceae bacterium]|nr:hypothetical protein [Parachlamydiaceae bacterium]